MKAKQFVTVKGHQLAYVAEGKGEPILLVHGITTYSFLWRNMMPRMAKDHGVIALDLLGCGDSDKPGDGDYSIKEQAGMVASFLDELGIERAHVVSHDIGGGIAQILAVHHPERVRTLTLINSIGYDYWPVQPITSLRIPILREFGMAALDHGFLKVLVKRGLFHKERATDELMDFFNAPLKTKEGRLGFLHLARALDNRHLTEITGGLKEMDIPTLIIRGDADHYLPPDIALRLHKDITGSKLIIVPTGSHFIQEDEPELLTGYIIEFIKAAEKEAVS